MPNDIRAERQALLSGLFPEGVPRLWCPPVAQYRPDGSLDAARIEAQLRSLAGRVGGLLVPGTTGDGWELPRAARLELLDIVLPLAEELGFRVLVGLLEPGPSEAVDFVRALGARLSSPAVVGVAACAPSGQGKSEEAVEAALRRILDLGLPTALYQLPQVTGNEFSAATVARLAASRANFLMIKDSSGADRVALSGLDSGGVILLRGAEGGYADWLAPRGPYAGFLLSTANWLAGPLAAIAAGGADRDLAERAEAAVRGAFALVEGLPAGNAFGNSAKLMDQVMAHGARAPGSGGPRMRGGEALPDELVARAVALLDGLGFLPARGYLEGGRV